MIAGLLSHKNMRLIDWISRLDDSSTHEHQLAQNEFTLPERGI
jgi:hypothetical protein